MKKQIRSSPFSDRVSTSRGVGDNTSLLGCPKLRNYLSAITCTSKTAYTSFQLSFSGPRFLDVHILGKFCLKTLTIFWGRIPNENTPFTDLKLGSVSQSRWTEHLLSWQITTVPKIMIWGILRRIASMPRFYWCLYLIIGASMKLPNLYAANPLNTWKALVGPMAKLNNSKCFVRFGTKWLLTQYMNIISDHVIIHIRF